MSSFNLKFSFYFFLIAFCLLFESFTFARKDYCWDDDSLDCTFLYKRLECCKCFIRCCHYHWEEDFYEGNDLHPIKPADRLCHEFFKSILIAKKSGPFTGVELKKFLKTDESVQSISEYFNTIEHFRRLITSGRTESIELRKSIYKLPREKAKLESEIKQIENAYHNAIKILNDLTDKIIPLYQEIINKCSHNTQFSVYNQGLIYSLQGNWNASVDEILKFIEIDEKKGNSYLSSEIYQACGEACLEINLYHEAIKALTKAIEKNPNNKKTYFSRACAYFETGCFDQALDDYLMSDKGKSFSTAQAASKEFSSAFLKSLRQGACEAAIDFVPSLCYSAYGLSEALWAIHPINPQALNNSQKLANACNEMCQGIVDYCKNVNWNTFEDYAVQIKNLYENYQQLNDTQKGELIGFAIGKYGVDILAGGTLLKGVTSFQKLKL